MQEVLVTLGDQPVAALLAEQDITIADRRELIGATPSFDQKIRHDHLGAGSRDRRSVGVALLIERSSRLASSLRRSSAEPYWLNTSLRGIRFSA